ncbi:Outer membrane protein OmpV [Vibrio tapetis subsp. tapetis]|uniref:Outer membrane protein OmpV n=2 Tax=Vibrio tapetis TaxID=52443 RepID=A0A2N8ZMY8_9VIBR|nr:outer membrane protein OmpV [Vibrio tapetis]SON53252.1 Outer membrane protein OmpV [Vibrio tapetis subsp. tapetis]
MNLKKTTLVISCLSALTAGSAFADANTTYIRNGNIYTNEGAWFVEAGGAKSSEFYDGQDKTAGFLLNGGYHGEDFNIDAAGINYRFYSTQSQIFQLSTFVAPGGLGYSADDASSLKGMDKRKMSLDLGLNLDVVLGDGTISTSIRRDVTGASKGLQSSLAYYHPFAMGSVDLVPFVGLSYADSKYVDYYYGVKASEKTASRAAYSGKGGAAYHLGYKLVFPINENINISQTTKYTRLGSNISDSPIVKSSNQWVTSLSVSYHF